MKEEFQIKHLYNYHTSKTMEMMYYDEHNNAKSIPVPEEGAKLNVNINMPECLSDQDYANNKYVTFRFVDHIYEAWIRVFRMGEVLYFTTKQAQAYSKHRALPFFVPAGHSFAMNFPMVSMLDDTNEAIWVIGTIDTMPGNLTEA